jgi:hypothetical protein
MVVLQTTNSGMGVGVSSAIARALGAGRRDRADALAFHALVLALGLGVTFSTVMLLGAPFMFRWMGGRDEMLADALSYANVALGGAVFICVSNLLGNAVRGTGNMSLPASVLVGCVLVHIAISPVLIFGLGPLPAWGRSGPGAGAWCAPPRTVERPLRAQIMAEKSMHFDCSWCAPRPAWPAPVHLPPPAADLRAWDDGSAAGIRLANARSEGSLDCCVVPNTFRAEVLVLMKSREGSTQCVAEDAKRSRHCRQLGRARPAATRCRLLVLTSVSSMQGLGASSVWRLL